MGWSFVAFGAVCLASVAYVAVFVPETKGRTLEEIEEDFRARQDKRFRRRLHAPDTDGAAKAEAGAAAG